jgi:hypothetical protein
VVAFPKSEALHPGGFRDQRRWGSEAQSRAGKRVTPITEI